MAPIKVFWLGGSCKKGIFPWLKIRSISIKKLPLLGVKPDGMKFWNCLVLAKAVSGLGTIALVAASPIVKKATFPSNQP